MGGGTVIDYAKIANSIDLERNLEKKIINNSYILKHKLSKLIAIPTTAGSGAEVTANAVIYINKIKHSIESELVKPDYFFLIPKFVMGASKKIKSSAGFDAIAQAVESLISKKSNLTSVKFAKKSLKISLKYYLDFLSKPTEENSSAMCLAANLSGKAISISKTTVPHAISYPFTSLYNISHGHAVSLTLEKFLKIDEVVLILTTGGTGISKRDVTPEATEKFIEKNIPGIPEMIRSSSFHKKNSSIIYRGLCGISNDKIILNLPGSPEGVKDGIEIAMKVLPHILEILDGKKGH